VLPERATGLSVRLSSVCGVYARRGLVETATVAIGAWVRRSMTEGWLVRLLPDVLELRVGTIVLNGDLAETVD
jgi:hypothetical protein